MAVLIEDMNVIVRVSTLTRRYPGGLVQYRRETLGDGFCCDGLLTRVGFRVRSDADVHLERLREKGLELATEFGFADAAFVDEYRGLPAGCVWLDTRLRTDDPSFAFLRGSDPGALIAIPRGWTLEEWEAREREYALSEPRSNMLFLRRDGESVVYLNRRTGQEVRVSRREEGTAGKAVN
jgi:hypothetical protein